MDDERPEDGKDIEERRNEELNLKETLVFILGELEREKALIKTSRKDMKDMNRYMYEELLAERQAELNFMLDEYRNSAKSAEHMAKQAAKFKKLLDSPYFGRFDFQEEGYAPEKIYLGYHNSAERDFSRIYVYDWRSPIASIYYRYSPGNCHYDAPSGRINGKLTRKRQLKVENSELKYFFDSDALIRDEMLMEVLSGNTSGKLKTIVETIQQEQDFAIRNLSAKTLIVQGSAGSGKTSIALHRAAYLLYEKDVSGVTSDNMLIISPNAVFSSYIGEALPELGEEAVACVTFSDLVLIACKLHVTDRGQYLESLTRMNPVKRKQMVNNTTERLSLNFVRLLEAFTRSYERRLRFSDIYLSGRLVISGLEIKKLFMDKTSQLPPQKRLGRIELMIANLAEPFFSVMEERVKQIVYEKGKYAFGEESRVNSLMSKARDRFKASVHNAMTVRPVEILKALCESKDERLMNDSKTLNAVRNGYLLYEDAAAMLYLHLLLNGEHKKFAAIRHVTVDEAQDYSPLHYVIFRKLFSNARFTVLGDINQSLGQSLSMDFYDTVSDILSKKDDESTALITLQKSYRSTYEIMKYANDYIGLPEPFSIRRGVPVSVIKVTENLIEVLTASVKESLTDGMKSIGVITQNRSTAETIYKMLTFTDKFLLIYDGESRLEGLTVLPFYTAKGLEFDAVCVVLSVPVSSDTEFWQGVHYVCSTRALHKLTVFDNSSC